MYLIPLPPLVSPTATGILKQKYGQTNPQIYNPSYATKPCKLVFIKDWIGEEQKLGIPASCQGRYVKDCSKKNKKTH